MLTRTLIRHHINAMPAGTPFSTRDLLQYGLRNTVDQFTWFLVKTNQLMRLARGIFLKPPEGKFKLPTATEIAAVKAKAFGKELFTHGRDAAHAMELEEAANTELTFSVKGGSTSFDTIYGRIYFRGTISKAIKKGNNPVGLIVRVLKHLDVELTRPLLSKVTEGLGRSQRNDLKQEVKWMPAWMSDAFISFWYACDYTRSQSLTRHKIYR
jgi:hypothetical protein